MSPLVAFFLVLNGALTVALFFIVVSALRWTGHLAGLIETMANRAATRDRIDADTTRELHARIDTIETKLGHCDE